MNRDLEKLFDQAADLTGPDRQKFLAENCSDPALRRELDLLLAHDDGAETFLQRAISDEASSALQSLVFAPGQRIGHYRVLSIIGRGGMPGLPGRAGRRKVRAARRHQSPAERA